MMTIRRFYLKLIDGEFLTSTTVKLLLLVVVISIATTLRFYKLGEWSFWIDELFSVRDTLAVDSFANLFRKFFFLFFLLNRPIVMTLGIDEWSTRLLPALIGIITIPVLYVVVSRIFNALIALATVGLLALSPWHLFWSQNARFYTLLLLLFSLSILAFYWGLETDRFRYFAASIVLWMLAMATHPTAAVFLPIIGLYLILLYLLPFERPRGYRWRNVGPFLALPILYVAYEVTRAISGRTLMAVDIAEKFLFRGSIDLTNSARLFLDFVVWMGVPIFVLALLGGLLVIIQKQRIGLLLVLAAFVPPIMLLAPRSYPRYVLLSLPFWIILAVIAVVEIWKQSRSYGIILATGIFVLILLDALGQDAMYFNFEKGRRPDWMRAFGVVQQQEEPGDLVFTDWPQLGDYYLGTDVMGLSEAEPDLITQSGQRVWIVDRYALAQDPDLERWVSENAELIEVIPVYFPLESRPVRVYLYDPLKLMPIAEPVQLGLSMGFT